MNSLKNLSCVGRLAVANSRRFADKPINPNDWKKLDSQLPEGLHPNFYKMKANQKRFQEPNGVPIYLKGGLSDKICLGITGIGLLFGTYVTYDTISSLP